MLKLNIEESGTSKRNLIKRIKKHKVVSTLVGIE